MHEPVPRVSFCAKHVVTDDDDDDKGHDALLHRQLTTRSASLRSSGHGCSCRQWR